MAKVKFRTREYEVASLTLDAVIGLHADGTIERLPSVQMVRLALIDSTERAEAVRKVILLALESGPDKLTREQLGAELDLECVERVYRAVLAESKLDEKPKESGAGEGKP